MNVRMLIELLSQCDLDQEVCMEDTPGVCHDIEDVEESMRVTGDDREESIVLLMRG